MARPDAAAPRRLIVNADDFGRSASINAAVIRCHREGILTTASLMVNEPWTAEAVALARENPRLGVGLHLTLLQGKAASNLQEASGLVGPDGQFTTNPVKAGMRYFFNRSLEPLIERELELQFARFRETGLVLDHVNGHLNMHLHPTVLRLLLRNTGRWGLRHLRLTSDPFWLNARLVGGKWPYRLSHAVIFGFLSAWAKPQLNRRGIRHTDRVFGLLQNSRVHEDYVLRLLEELSSGDSELYTHPSLDEFRHETEALISPRVRDMAARRRVQLIRYQDL
jgi:chitin disaccharide deacetylase